MTTETANVMSLKDIAAALTSYRIRRAELEALINGRQVEISAKRAEVETQIAPWLAEIDQWRAEVDGITAEIGDRPARATRNVAGARAPAGFGAPIPVDLAGTTEPAKAARIMLANMKPGITYLKRDMNQWVATALGWVIADKEGALNSASNAMWHQKVLDRVGHGKYRLSETTVAARLAAESVAAATVAPVAEMATESPSPLSDEASAPVVAEAPASVETPTEIVATESATGETTAPNRRRNRPLKGGTE